MASSEDKTGAAQGPETNPVLQVIDPVYQKYAKSVIRALGSSDFYEYFMDSIAHAQNEIQFSNRRVEKLVDLHWVDSVEKALGALQNVIASPRKVIREDEFIVDIANAKKTTSDSVRHLAMHAALIEDYNEDSGDVRPNKIMQKYREDSIGQVYENRVVFTALEMAHQFVKIRYDALFESMGDEFGAKLKLTSDMETSIETVHLDMFLHIRDLDTTLETDDKNRDVFDRIARLHRILSMAMNSHFARHMSRYPRVKGTLTKTNVLKRNKDYRAAMELLEFLRSYDSIGYVIKVVEQNPVIDENFERDIYHNILFNYLVLKGHLERDKDRRLPAPMKQKKKTLKPKFIKQIIEELTEDYDLPDVEIRKVLIEELTKEQLMREEEAERRRLVEEQEQRRKEEAERIRREKEAEKERIRREKEAERERIRQEKAAEEQRLLQERMEREQEDRRRSGLFREELAYFKKHLEGQKEARAEAAEQEEIAKQDFEDAAQILEETERLKQEEAARERQRRREERDRIRREQELAALQAAREEEERQERERQAALAEQERQRQAELAEQERLAREQQEKEEQARREQEERDMLAVCVYVGALQHFRENLSQRLALREEQAEQQKREQEAREQERRKRLEARQSTTN